MAAKGGTGPAHVLLMHVHAGDVRGWPAVAAWHTATVAPAFAAHPDELESADTWRAALVCPAPVPYAVHIFLAHAPPTPSGTSRAPATSATGSDREAPAVAATTTAGAAGTMPATPQPVCTAATDASTELSTSSASAQRDPVAATATATAAAAAAALGGVVGEYYPRSNCGLMTYLVVMPTAQRSGLARRLVTALINALDDEARRGTPTHTEKESECVSE
jgi:hypothetical protein